MQHVVRYVLSRASQSDRQGRLTHARTVSRFAHVRTMVLKNGFSKEQESLLAVVRLRGDKKCVFGLSLTKKYVDVLSRSQFRRKTAPKTDTNAVDRASYRSFLLERSRRPEGKECNRGKPENGCFAQPQELSSWSSMVVLESGRWGFVPMPCHQLLKKVPRR